MSDLSYWIKSGSYSILYRIFVFIFGFGSFFCLTRYLSVEKFGVWALFIIITSLAEMIRTAFIQNALIKFFYETNIEKSTIFYSSLILNAIYTLVFSAILLLGLPIFENLWKTSEIRGMLYWYCASSVFLIFFTQINFLEQANQSFKGVFWSNVTRQGSLFISILICFIFTKNLSLNFFSFVYFYSTVLGLAVSIIVSRKLIPKKFNFSMAYLKKLVSHGKFILGTGITSALGKYFDQFILGSINLGIVALYNSSVRVINMLEIPVLSIASVSYPKLANQIEANDSLHNLARMYERTVAGILALIIPVIIPIILFPEKVLLITAGSKYVEGADILRIMVTFAILLPFNVQFGNICEIINKPNVSFKINLITNVLSVILNLLFIKTYGAKGAALVFSFTLIFIFIFSQVYLSRKIKIKLLNIIYHIFQFYKLGLNLTLIQINKYFSPTPIK